MKRISKLTLSIISISLINCNSNQHSEGGQSYRIEPNSINDDTLSIREEREINPKITINIDD